MLYTASVVLEKHKKHLWELKREQMIGYAQGISAGKVCIEYPNLPLVLAELTILGRGFRVKPRERQSHGWYVGQTLWAPV